MARRNHAHQGVDFGEANAPVLVLDMNNPGNNIGSDTWCDLPRQAFAIIEHQSRKNEAIFPYSAASISAAFTRACQFLKIEDRRSHERRHDGVSRLFDLGSGLIDQSPKMTAAAMQMAEKNV